MVRLASVCPCLSICSSNLGFGMEYMELARKSENINHGSVFADFPTPGQRGIVTLTSRWERGARMLQIWGQPFWKTSPVVMLCKEALLDVIVEFS